ncbi:MAG: hypothetical protein HOV87_31295 [Catenulispora sp.]|nr:hypothetical protein [Catenulispora sp.]
MLLSAAWPILLFITTEVMFWKGWSQGPLWTAVRCVSMVLVAAPVANASYHHLSGLYRHFFPDDRLTVWFGPLAIDGATLMCTAALQSRAHRLRQEQLDVPGQASPANGRAAEPVSPASPASPGGELQAPAGDPSGELPPDEVAVADPIGEVSAGAAVNADPGQLTGEATAPLPISPPASPGRDGEDAGELTASPVGSPSEETDRPSDQEIMLEAQRLRPEGPFSANWLVRTFGIGTGRATRLLNQLAPALVAEAAAIDAENAGTAQADLEPLPGVA